MRSDDSALSIEEMVSALRTDPVLVHTMLGGGDTAAAEARIEAAVEELDHPVYVAVVKHPDELQVGEDAESLAVHLADELGDGLYVVLTDEGGHGVVANGVDLDPTTLSLAAYDSYERIEAEQAPVSDDGYTSMLSPTASAEVLLAVADAGGVRPDEAVLDEIGQAATAFSAVQPPAPTGDWLASVDELTLAAAFAGTLVLMASRRLLTWWPARRLHGGRSRVAPRGPAALPTVEALRESAGSELDRLSRALQQLPADAAASAAGRRAVAAREAAEQVLTGESTADLIGALVLARTGRADARLATGGRRARRHRCCFFSPLHGEAETHSRRASGGDVVEVPTCRRCAEDLEEHRDPDVLTARRRGPDRPYYELDDVWAETGYGSLVDDFAVRVLDARARR